MKTRLSTNDPINRQGSADITTSKLHPPVPHGKDNRPQRQSFLRHRILHAWRYFRIDLSRDDPITFQFPQLFRQCLLADPFDQPMDLAKAADLR
jgi:hypothetical protein